MKAMLTQLLNFLLFATAKQTDNCTEQKTEQKTEPNTKLQTDPTNDQTNETTTDLTTQEMHTGVLPDRDGAVLYCTVTTCQKQPSSQN